MTITVQLSVAGTSTTLFNLFSNINYSTPLVTGITKAQLLAGYSLLAVPDNATIIRVQATGVCDNQVDLAISGLTTTSTTSTSTSTSTTLPTTTTSTSTTSTSTTSTTLPTTTSTTTSTTTVPVSDVLEVSVGLSCSGTFVSEYTYYVGQTTQNFALQNGNIVYEDQAKTIPINGYNTINFTGIFNSVRYTFNVSTVGVISGLTICETTTTSTTSSTTSSTTTTNPLPGGVNMYTITQGYTSALLACQNYVANGGQSGGSGTPQTVYSLPSLDPGNIVYNSNGTPFVGNPALYYVITDYIVITPGLESTIQINSIGQIINFYPADCLTINV